MSVDGLGKAQCQNEEDSSRDAGGAGLTFALLCRKQLVYCMCLRFKLILRLVLECWCWKASRGFLGSIVSFSAQEDGVKI